MYVYVVATDISSDRGQHLRSFIVPTLILKCKVLCIIELLCRNFGFKSWPCPT